MNNHLIRYRIVTDRGSGFAPGNFINVFWDDVADAVVVKKYTDALDNVGVIITSGPDLGADRRDHVSVGLRPIPYKFCDGTTLNTFVVRSTFPYVDHVLTANHFSCDVLVCDIRIVGATSTDASDTTTADGSITVTAETSSPDIKYSLDSEFAGGGQLSGQFTGLIAGTYIVYAKDSRGCSTDVTVIVGTPQTYATKYRLEYLDRNHRNSRTDILERGYTGEVIPVCGSGDPFVIKYNGDGELNRFKTVIPSEARLTLSSPENFYFRELFSQDERKFKLEHSKDFGVIQAAVDNLPALNTFVNDDQGGTLIRPNWTLGSNPSVTLPPDEDDSVYLSGVINLPVGSIEIQYDIDVLTHSCRLLFRTYHIDNPAIADEVIIPFVVGSNIGSFFINVTSPSDFFKVIANQLLPQLPAINSWLSRSETSRVPWGDSIDAKTVTLNGNVGGFQLSQNLYAPYAFLEGQTYTVEAEIEKTVFSGSPNSAVYFSGRNDSFFAVYSPFGQTFNSGTGTYTLSITFTAPSGMTAFAMQLYVTGTGSINFVVNSIQITNSTSAGTTVTINELSSSTPEISGLQLKWTGYVISPNYSEPYTPDPYNVTVVATDGLADLNTFDFVDLYGNKFQSDIVTMDAVVSILRKTDLGLNIITAVNRLEVSMSTNALTESMFNPDTFYDEDGSVEDCSFALDQILKTFGVRIFQRNAKWIIQTVEEMTHEFQAMEFDASGTFIQSLLIQDIMPITNPVESTNAAFKERDQVLEVVPAYGVLSFQHSLIQNPSLVKSYSFELEDISLTPDGVTSFKNWNINIENAPGAEYGIKETKSFQGDFNFFYKVPIIPYSNPGYTVVLTSTEGIIEYDATDLFEFKFDYATITGNISKSRTSASGTPLAPERAHYPFWVRMKWSLRIGNYYFDSITGDWSTTKKYNDIYVDTFNDPQNFKIVGPMREVTALTLESFQVEFVLYDEQVFDFTYNGDFSELEAIPTVTLPVGYRVKGRIIYTAPLSETVVYMYYELAAEDTATDGFKSRRPSDYDDDDNPVVWILQEETVVRRSGARANFLSNRPSREIPITYQYMDNVVLRLLPGGTEPPDNITIRRTNNLNIKVNFEDEFLFNDIDIDNINNSERIYKNYFKKLDGTPTQIWHRTYRSGQGKLMELFSADFLSQYKDAANKLTGSMLVADEITFSTLMRELFDSNKLYMFMGMELHDREYSVIFDMLELKDVVNDDASGAIDAGFTAGFTLGFRA